MSELDLNASAAPAAPETSSTSALFLRPPPPVQVVDQEEAAGAVPLEQAKQAELRQKAKAFAADLATLDVNSPAYTQKINGITTMGERDMRAVAGMSNRMLDRPAASLGGKGKQRDDAQSRVSGTLIDLRSTITELDPNRADLKGVRKLLKFLPGGDRIDRYFAKYESAQAHLNAIIRALDSGQDELRKDNASIDTEKTTMWTTMGKLSEYNELAGALDVEVDQQIAELEARGRSKDADTLKADALFPIRQRRQDIMTQMAVAVQGYLALDLVRRNNIELIKGVDRAQTTTISALRTAIIVSQALARQKLVLQQVSALNTTTSALIEATSRQLQVQGAEINQQAASSTIEVAKLQAAFDNVFATMDALDTFRVQATDSMAQTVNALQGQIERAKPYLERTRRREAVG
ncbi:toxic anion resistance protein [Amycolatopsis sp. H20-H5]|uniref:toxic anion resistance protein n=1 Tax=Amycolatopsis sp. H20-H5 TaxID=3046309 RepID=UPI002DBC334E|nr:toxic anion resistance protein [Amycolatopsis sp. H20-H5]MEC3982136.1 toxic anion resistance protein [Amycolatopsis sp. H20-H5]